MDRVLIISGMFPPMRGGLPDHTDRLASELGEQHEVTVLTSVGVDTNRRFRVRAEVANWHDGAGLAELARSAAGGGAILWQYVPHMYGRGGVNLAVPAVMERLEVEGRRQVVLAHEIRAPFSWWPHRSGYALAHRLMWRRVRRAARAIGISTGSWLERIRAERPGDGRYFLAPSPANVSVVDVDAGHSGRWRGRHALSGATWLLGFFGSVGTGKQFEWVVAAWREVRRREPKTGLVVMGGKPDLELSEDERIWFRPLGYLGSAEVSEAMQALDLLLLPFEDGVSERRSSFMVGLAHGTAVLTTLGEGTGKELRAGGFFRGVAVEAGIRAFAEEAGRWMEDAVGRGNAGRRAMERYRSAYDWRVLGSELRRRLLD